MALRKASAYTKRYARPYTRNSKKRKKSYIKTVPNSRIVKFKMGDLKGFDDELAVLSGNTATSYLAESIVSEHGEDPNVWLPIFHKKRQELI